MRAFIITSMTLALIGAVLRLVVLTYGGYPRIATNTRQADAFYILIALCWSAWAAWLLLA